MNSEELEGLRALVSPIFADAAGGPFSVHLYGSQATGFARADSDYDFADLRELVRLALRVVP
jgi:hypothetical protein